MRRLMLRPLLIVLLIPAPLVLWYAVPDHHVWHPRHSIGLALIVAGTALWFAVRLKVHGKLNATPQARFIVRNARPDRRLSQQCANRKEFCFAAEWISYPQQQERELAARVVRTRTRLVARATQKSRKRCGAVRARDVCGNRRTGARFEDVPTMTIRSSLHHIPFLSLIVPCYNGETLLPTKLDELRTFLGAQPYTWELLLADDGSRPPAAEVLREFASANDGVTVIRNPTNLGKGASVVKAMLAARGQYRIFTDIDLAYPPSQITRILDVLQSGADVAIACRALPESRYEMSPAFIHYLFTRHVLSRILNRAVRLTLLRDILDTQAGLKGFTAAAAGAIFSRLTIPRFGFDIELLFVAQKHRLRIVQSPVVFRYDDEPSTVNFVRSAVTIGGDFLRIRRNSARGRYD